MEGPSSNVPAVTLRRLEGKVALITGGASGIGEGTARVFARHGAKVVITDVQDDLGHAICKDINDQQSFSYIHCDITNESDVQNAVDFTVEKHGKLDIMFNNAAVPGDYELRLLETDSEDFRRVLDVNVYGCFLGAKHAARVMIPTKSGVILFTASDATMTYGLVPHAYCTSKTAILGLTRNLCVELGKYGIRVNCLSPFFIPTPMLNKVFFGMEKEKLKEMFYESANLKHAVLEVKDVAEAAVFLGSDDSKYVSGLNLVIDGGYSLTNPSIELSFQKYFSSLSLGSSQS